MVKQSGMTKNSEFVNKIMGKYQRDVSGNSFGLTMVYRRQKKESGSTVVKQNISRLVTQEFYTRLKRYENRYYQRITSQDNRKLIQTIEQIYNQPGEKKQLMHVFKKLGVVTKSQEEWQETRKTLKQYEEELVQMKRRIASQEEYFLKIRNHEEKAVSTKAIAREVMENIRKEIRMERLRYGLD